MKNPFVLLIDLLGFWFAFWFCLDLLWLWKWQVSRECACESAGGWKDVAGEDLSVSVITASAQTSSFMVLSFSTFAYIFVHKIITEHFPYDRHCGRPWELESLDKHRLGWGTTRRGRFLAKTPK